MKSFKGRIGMRTEKGKKKKNTTAVIFVPSSARLNLPTYQTHHLKTSNDDIWKSNSFQSVSSYQDTELMPARFAV